MRVVIAGGHGQIALRLERLLTLQGDEAIGLVRNPDHAADLADVGATAVVLDLEHATAAAMRARAAHARLARQFGVTRWVAEYDRIYRDAQRIDRSHHS
jgi:nucleoside-diphosphate-sugar epimerase